MKIFFRSARPAFSVEFGRRNAVAEATAMPAATPLNRRWDVQYGMNFRYIRKRKNAVNAVAVCFKSISFTGCEDTVKEGVMLNPSIPLVATRRGGKSWASYGKIPYHGGIPYTARRQQGATLACAAGLLHTAGCARADCFSCASWRDITRCRELGGGDPGNFSEICLSI